MKISVSSCIGYNNTGLYSISFVNLRGRKREDRLITVKCSSAHAKIVLTKTNGYMEQNRDIIQ